MVAPPSEETPAWCRALTLLARSDSPADVEVERRLALTPRPLVPITNLRLTHPRLRLARAAAAALGLAPPHVQSRAQRGQSLSLSVGQREALRRTLWLTAAALPPRPSQTWVEHARTHTPAWRPHLHTVAAAAGVRLRVAPREDRVRAFIAWMATAQLP
mmetsp:Transcript_72282/g.170051  ORF Transcript_72282/g.170051 Transcript_72282/m.170051 type:complete len:159 (+) Transcript_72282:394-870(+)